MAVVHYLMTSQPKGLLYTILYSFMSGYEDHSGILKSVLLCCYQYTWNYQCRSCLWALVEGK